MIRTIPAPLMLKFWIVSTNDWNTVMASSLSSNRLALNENVERVHAKDISVVVAGLVRRDGAKGDLALACIRSIRAMLPESEIILSTWLQCDTYGLEVDVLVKSSEPQSTQDCTGRASNFHKQRLSVCAGLAKASRTYVLKFRPDIILKGLAIIDAFDSRHELDPPGLLGNRVILTNLFIPNPLFDPTLFHISDIVQFGTKADILRIWSNSASADISLLGNAHPRRIFGNFSGYTDFRLLPEQALTVSWLNSEQVAVSLDHINDGSARQLNEWISILFGNYIILDARNSGIEFPQRFFGTRLKRNNLSDELRMLPLYFSQVPRFKALRAIKYYVNKYIYCWVNSNYLKSIAHVIIHTLFPRETINRIWKNHVTR